MFAVLLYDGVEPVDLATFGVLSMARRLAPGVRAFTVANAPGPVALASGLTVLADHGFDSCPESDALIVTGGPGWSRECGNPAMLDFLRRYGRGRLVAGVCTGAMILAAAGLLEGRKATTKSEVAPGETPPTALLRERHPGVEVLDHAGIVDCGMVVTGGGVTLGIDVTLHLLERLLGAAVADETARIMEYARARAANRRERPVVFE